MDPSARQRLLYTLRRHQERQDGSQRHAGQRARLRFGQRVGHYSAWRDGRTGWGWFFQCS